MYEADPDPYCYRGTTILKNKAGLVEQVRLDEFETAMTVFYLSHICRKNETAEVD